MDIRPCTIADIRDACNIKALVDEYASYAVPGIPVHDIDWSRYEALEAAGVLRVIGAFHDAVLAGFVIYTLYTSLHYNVPVVTTESVFVGKAYRATGAGMRLIKTLEHTARKCGAAALLVTAPYRKELSMVLPRIGYAPSHEVYCKVLA